jgi:hypothetical protein
MTDKLTNRLWVTVNADVKLCGNFVPEHRSPSQVRLDVNPMRRHQVYQFLKTAELSARISHGANIVRSDDESKHFLRAFTMEDPRPSDPILCIRLAP